MQWVTTYFLTGDGIVDVFSKNRVADGEGFDENSLTCYFESEYSETANPHCAKTCEFSEIADFTPDDRESLETIFSLWSGLTPEMKSGFLHMIEAAAKVYTGR